MKRHVSISFFLACMFTFVPAAAYATECTRATSNIEKALCGDELHRIDEGLNKQFAKLIKVLPDASEASLLTEQRAWIKRRDASCAALAANDLINCLRTMTIARAKELRESPTGEHIPVDFSSIGGQELKVGDHKLKLLSRIDPATDSDSFSLVYNDVLIAESVGSFELDGHFQNKVLDAVLLAANRGGTADCADYFVIEARFGKPLKASSLGSGVKTLCGYNVKNTPRGFLLTKAAAVDGSSVQYAWTSDRYFGFAGPLCRIKVPSWNSWKDVATEGYEVPFTMKNFCRF